MMIILLCRMGTRYLLFDEPLLLNMSKKGWNRALGYTPLITMACGLCEDWLKHKAVMKYILREKWHTYKKWMS